MCSADRGDPESDLHEAAWNGDLARVRKLVESGVDVNWTDSIGETALFGASSWGNTDVVCYLIGKGAEVNVREQRGYTPLHWAASHGNLKTLRALVVAGADPGATDDMGQLPIDVAHSGGKGSHVAYLKTVGPPIRIRRDRSKRLGNPPSTAS